MKNTEVLISRPAQVVSYEVPLGLCVIIPVMICGTMNLITIGEMQKGTLNNWLIFHDPFTFCVFWVYFTCGMASVNRAPFDLAEAESELVAGFHTEYSGLRWSIFFMAEYGSMFVISALAVILFFGGWNGPLPVFAGLAYEAGETSFRWGGYFANLAGCINFILKTVVGVTVMMWVRWTLPRLRIDQVITMCWKYCVPISAVCFVGVLAWQTFGLPTGGTLDRITVRENWVLAAFEEPEVDNPAEPGEAAEGTSEDEGEGATSDATEQAESKSGSTTQSVAAVTGEADDLPGGRK